LSHWKMHYDMPYSHQTRKEDIYDPNFRYVFLGARRGDEESIFLGAVGETAVVFSQEADIGSNYGAFLKAMPHNGAFWYCSPEASIGFSPSEDVFLYLADCAEFQGRKYADPSSTKLRLSWNLDFGSSTGGFRAGEHQDLGDAPGAWRKVVYYSDTIA